MIAIMLALLIYLHRKYRYSIWPTGLFALAPILMVAEGLQ